MIFIKFQICVAFLTYFSFWFNLIIHDVEVLRTVLQDYGVMGLLLMKNHEGTQSSSLQDEVLAF